MSLRRALYRARQFWHAWSASPAAEDLDAVKELLTPAQMALFNRMQPSEQAHSLAVMEQIRNAPGEISQPYWHDLLVASLLHDVGKTRYPLHVWERVAIVLCEAVAPSLAERLGKGSPQGWRHAFVVARKHAEWGAEMAAEAGSSSLTTEIIRRHQNQPAAQAVSIAEELQRVLYAADNDH